EFIRFFGVALATTSAILPSLHLPGGCATQSPFIGEAVFAKILARANSENWKALPIGDLMAKIAMELQGTPYKASTLDYSLDSETCSIDMTGLDCVTFFETTLGFARMIKKGGSTPEDLLGEVRFTRYRSGKQGDYTSRLHYTSDWLLDNQKKGVVKLLSLPGEEKFTQNVGIMSSKPNLYKQLEAHPELIPKIKAFEDTINRHKLKFVPLSKLKEAEALLKSGDLVGVCTDMPGIDISHTGLIIRDSENIPHFMDASSGKSKMKVTLEPGPISQALNWSKSITGAIFARPLEPKS
ncbi:MAG: DUF1460 domain-containing protein, partial [Candidatus Obscuribacterales bacterium]|nr:DUF1460 domain-containing protein [Candidatus Obscuribacterales bacterium]